MTHLSPIFNPFSLISWSNSCLNYAFHCYLSSYRFCISSTLACNCETFSCRSFTILIASGWLYEAFRASLSKGDESIIKYLQLDKRLSLEKDSMLAKAYKLTTEIFQELSLTIHVFIEKNNVFHYATVVKNIEGMDCIPENLKDLQTLQIILKDSRNHEFDEGSQRLLVKKKDQQTRKYSIFELQMERRMCSIFFDPVQQNLNVAQIEGRKVRLLSGCSFLGHFPLAMKNKFTIKILDQRPNCQLLIGIGSKTSTYNTLLSGEKLQKGNIVTVSFSRQKGEVEWFVNGEKQLTHCYSILRDQNIIFIPYLVFLNRRGLVQFEWLE